MTADEARALPAGTVLWDPLDEEVVVLHRVTDLGDGWWLRDGSWVRFEHMADWRTVVDATATE
jgi:hypothetical protein